MLPNSLFEKIQYVKLDERLFLNKECTQCYNILKFVEQTGNHVIPEGTDNSSIITYEYLTPDKQLLTREIVVNNCCLWQNEFSKLKVVYFDEIDYDLVDNCLNDSVFLKKFNLNNCVTYLKERFVQLKSSAGNSEHIFTGNVRVINRSTRQFVDLSTKLFEAFEKIVKCEPFCRVWSENKCEQDDFLEALTKVVQMFPAKKNLPTEHLESKVETLAQSINELVSRLNKRKVFLKNRLVRKHNYQKMQKIKYKIKNYKCNEIDYMNSRKGCMVDFFKVLKEIKEGNINYKLKEETNKLGLKLKFKMQNLKFFIPYMRKHCPKELRISEEEAKMFLRNMISLSIHTEIIFIASVLWNVPSYSLNDGQISNVEKFLFDSSQNEFYNKFEYHQNAINKQMEKVDRFSNLKNFYENEDSNLDDFNEFYDEKFKFDDSSLYSNQVTKVLWNNR